MLNVKTLIAAVTVFGAVAPAAAHHAAEVIYPADKELVLTGTVKEFRYVNPHAVLELVVPENGRSIEWTVLTDSPIELNKSGIAKSTFQPGEPVTVRLRPAPSGKTAGWLLDARKQDGTLFSVDD